MKINTLVEMPEGIYKFEGELGENEFWECSHVECPNRFKVTPAPSDPVPMNEETP